MSHSSGTVTFISDDKKYWFEYNGTSDICIPMIYKTQEEMEENWRSGKWRTCYCGNESEEVVIEDSHYGEGFSWKGKACRKCMCITEGLNYNDVEEH